MTIDKTLNDILNHFAEYAKYDPDQKRFNLLSDNYKFHQAGKVMEMLISEYDPSGVLAVMYAKREFLNSLKKRVDLGSPVSYTHLPANPYAASGTGDPGMGAFGAGNSSPRRSQRPKRTFKKVDLKAEIEEAEENQKKQKEQDVYKRQVY